MNDFFLKNALVVVFGIGMLIQANTASGFDFTDDDKQALAAGEIVGRPLAASGEDGIYGGTSWAIIDAPLEQVWQTVTDFESYPQIFPKTVESKELSRKGDHSLVRLQLGYNVIRVVCHVDVHQDEQKRVVSFKMVKNYPNDIDHSRGYWRLFPQKNNRTLVAYVSMVQLPIGLVNMFGAALEQKFEWGLLHTAGYLKKWIETKNAKTVD